MSEQTYIFSACLVIGAATFVTRVAPFFFSRQLQKSQTIAQLGKTLPAAIMLILVIYCIRDATFFPLAEVLGIGTVVLIHLWKRNALLSMITGTAIFMLVGLWL